MALSDTLLVPEAARPFLGNWRHVAPWSGDDYLAEYLVSWEIGALSVVGRDLSDGETFQISDISFDGRVLRFRSFMPSTRREGVNEFSLTATGEIESRFTFTVVERMVRHAT
jgi:hypothetical protein